jgi:hypothetical protein
MPLVPPRTTWHHPHGTTGAESPPLARKPNYDFEKRRKELDRKAKKDAKREDRRRRRDQQPTEELERPSTAPDDGEAKQPGLGAPAI